MREESRGASDSFPECVLDETFERAGTPGLADTRNAAKEKANKYPHDRSSLHEKEYCGVCWTDTTAQNCRTTAG